MKKVFITRPIPAPVEDILKSAGFLVEVGKEHHGLAKPRLIKALVKGKYDAMISFLTDTIDKEVIDAFGGKIIANYAVGFNNIDITYAKSKGIYVTNTPLVSPSVAEFTSALILAASKRIVEADTFVKEDRYRGWDPHIFLGHDLKGKVLGIVGAGNIGQQTAHAMHLGFGMEIVYHDIKTSSILESDCSARKIDSLDELFKISDVISLHTPLLPETKHLVNRDRLKLMKESAVLVNTSRGGVIDEEALIEFLDKKIYRMCRFGCL
jgi:glyoxylate reductase